MAKARVGRTPAAIVAADVAGHDRLTAADEAGDMDGEPFGKTDGCAVVLE